MVLIRRDEGYWRKYVTAARAGLIAGVLVICAAASNPPAPSSGIGNQPPKPTSESHAAEPKQSQQGTKQNPFIVQVISSDQSSNKSATATQENSYEAANWWLVRLTFGLIIVGLIQAVVFWVQAGRLKQTIIKMDEISARQLRAYVLITEATIVAADQNGRAILAGIEHGGINIEIGSGFRPLIRLKVTNTGQTPAKELTVYGRAKITAWPILDADLPKLPFQQKEISKSLLGRDQSSDKYEILEILTDADMACLSKGCSAIVVFGEIHYVDVFGDDQITKYRYFTGGPVNIRGGTLSAHENGNEAT